MLEVVNMFSMTFKKQQAYFRYLYMTLEQYQAASSIYQTKQDDIERMAWCICIVFKKKPEKVNEWSRWKFFFYSRWLGWKFSKVTKQSWHKLKFITDATKITLGQFIEVEHFLKQESIHHVAASIWKRKGDHSDKAERLNLMNVRKVLPAVTKFTQSYMELLQSYAGLFEITEEVMEGEPEPPHPFQQQYGWIYSAKAVAEFEGITLDKAYDLPIIQALNDLSYLKAYKSYQDEKSSASSNRRRFS